MDDMAKDILKSRANLAIEIEILVSNLSFVSPKNPSFLIFNPLLSFPFSNVCSFSSFPPKILVKYAGLAMKGGKPKSETKRSDAKLKVKASKKSAKDPNKPKRPASAFFVFMEEFRQQFKEKHPNNKSVAAVGKAGGVKWKSMSDAEKAPFVAKAEKRKTEYNKNMAAYNKRTAGGNGDNESEKSKSEVNDEDSEEEEEDDE